MCLLATHLEVKKTDSLLRGYKILDCEMIEPCEDSSSDIRIVTPYRGNIVKAGIVEGEGSRIESQSFGPVIIEEGYIHVFKYIDEAVELLYGISTPVQDKMYLDKNSQSNPNKRDVEEYPEYPIFKSFKDIKTAAYDFYNYLKDTYQEKIICTFAVMVEVEIPAGTKYWENEISGEMAAERIIYPE